MELITDRRPVVIGVIVALALLVVALPVGLLTWANTSGANFAESEDVGVNHLGAATLDVEAGTASEAVGARNMAPGDSAFGSLELRNSGSLRLRYAVTAEVSEGPLSRWLRWDIWTDPAGCSAGPGASARMLREGFTMPAPTAPFLGDPGIGLDTGDRVLSPDQREILCYRATLPLDASNEVQGAEIIVDFVVDAEHDVDPES